MTKMVIILEGEDLLFAQIAQGAKVGGATLPSGLKVPTMEGKVWVISGNFIKCETLKKI